MGSGGGSQVVEYQQGLSPLCLISTAPSAAVAVPEPTSALLLVLGMAGLALKRKRA